MYLKMPVHPFELDLKRQIIQVLKDEEVAMAITVVIIAIGILYIPK